MFDFTDAKLLDITTSTVYESVIPSKEWNDELVWEIPLSAIAKSHLKKMTKSEMDENWKLDEFFSVFVINLPQTTERLKIVKEELEGIGTGTFSIFPGIDGRKDISPEIWKKFYLNLHNIDTSTKEGKIALDRLHQGQAGCYMSHFKLIQHLKNSFENALAELALAKINHDQEARNRAIKKVRRYSRALILEDDSGFGILNKSCTSVSKNSVGVILRKALRDVPKDWDMLYFLVNATEKTKKVSKYLRKLNNSWCMVAYAVNHTMYKPIVDQLKKIEDPEVTQVWPVDNEISVLHSSHKVYAIYPSIIYTHGGISLITERTWKPWQGQPIYPQP